ncbi:MAG: ketoacyl-ACP synthase III [Candidatus Aminicenantes bacterium]|nr:ketoacyl-ACP synthase III [Candidatus Aminicenantes bacterium]
MTNTIILGSGSYLPEKVMTNDDWAKLVDTSDEWISTRSGIKERHFAAENEACSDLVMKAAEIAIADAGIDKDDIDLIVVGTVSADNAYPSTGNWTQKKLGIKAIPSFDISAGCSSFLYGMIMANSFIKSGLARHVLVAGAEIMSRIINWEDRNTCVLFGDGAGAVVLGASESEPGILSTYWGADGNLGDLLIQPAGGSAIPASEESVAKKLHSVHMKGNEVYKHAVLRMQESAMKAIELANITSDDIDLYIPHQANIRIIEATIKRAGIPAEKTFINIEKIANISGGTIPIALDQARKQGRLKKGDHLLMSAFGAGFTWAGIVVKM